MNSSLKVGDVVIFSYGNVTDVGVVTTDIPDAQGDYGVLFFDPDRMEWGSFQERFCGEDLVRIGNVEEWGREEFGL